MLGRAKMVVVEGDCPQGLKPILNEKLYGTAEAVPLTVRLSVAGRTCPRTVYWIVSVILLKELLVFESQFEERLYNERREKLRQIGELGRKAGIASDLAATYPNQYIESAAGWDESKGTIVPWIRATSPRSAADSTDRPSSSPIRW